MFCVDLDKIDLRAYKISSVYFQINTFFDSGYPKMDIFRENPKNRFFMIAILFSILYDRAYV